MQKWEFLSETVDMAGGMPLMDAADRYGSQGWELVSVAPVTDQRPPFPDERALITGHVLYFKRPLED